MADRGGYSPLLVGGRPLMSDGTLGEENMFSEPEPDWGGIEAPVANGWSGIEPPAVQQPSYDEEFLGRMQSAGAIRNPASADYAPIALGNVMRSRRGLPGEVSSREQSRQDEQLRYRLWDQGYDNASIDDMTASEYEAKRREFEPDQREQQVYDATTALRKALTSDYLPPENQQDWPQEMFDGADNLGEPLNITALKSQLKAAHAPKDESNLEDLGKKPDKAVGETEQLKRLEALRSEAYQRAQRGKLMEPEFTPKLMEMESLKTELKAKYPDFANEPEFKAFDKETTKWLKRAANANADQFKKDVEATRKNWNDGIGGDFSGSEAGGLLVGVGTGARGLAATLARGAGTAINSTGSPGIEVIGNALSRLSDRLQYGNRVLEAAQKQAVDEQQYGAVRSVLGRNLPGVASSGFQAIATAPAGMGGMTLAFGATAANDAYYKAKSEGVSEDVAVRSAIIQGGFEMLFMTLFNKLGQKFPGMEGMQAFFGEASEQMAKKGFWNGVKRALLRMSGENIEEGLTTIGQQLDSVMTLPSLAKENEWTTKGKTGLPGFLSSPGMKAMVEALQQTAEQTTLMMGLGEATSRAGQILGQEANRPALNSLKEFMDSPTRRKWEKLPAEIRQTYPLDPKSTEQQRRDLAEKMRRDAESAARQAAGAPDVQAATPADIADEVAPSLPASGVPLGDEPTDSAIPTLSEQDAQEVRDWVESLGVDEILGTPDQPGYLPQLEARENPDEATLLTIQLMREAVAADSEPGVTSEVPETPTTMEGGDPNGQVQEVRQGELQVQVPQVEPGPNAELEDFLSSAESDLSNANEGTDAEAAGGQDVPIGPAAVSSSLTTSGRSPDAVAEEAAASAVSSSPAAATGGTVASSSPVPSLDAPVAERQAANANLGGDAVTTPASETPDTATRGAIPTESAGTQRNAPAPRTETVAEATKRLDDRYNELVASGKTPLEALQTIQAEGKADSASKVSPPASPAVDTQEKPNAVPTESRASVAKPVAKAAKEPKAPAEQRVAPASQAGAPEVQERTRRPEQAEPTNEGRRDYAAEIDRLPIGQRRAARQWLDSLRERERKLDELDQMAAAPNPANGKPWTQAWRDRNMPKIEEARASLNADFKDFENSLDPNYQPEALPAATAAEKAEFEASQAKPKRKMKEKTGEGPPTTTREELADLMAENYEEVQKRARQAFARKQERGPDDDIDASPAEDAVGDLAVLLNDPAAFAEAVKTRPSLLRFDGKDNPSKEFIKWAGQIAANKALDAQEQDKLRQAGETEDGESVLDNLADRASQAHDEVREAFRDFGRSFGAGTFGSTGFSAESLRKFAVLTGKIIKAGALDFAAFSARIAEMVSPRILEALQPHLRSTFDSEFAKYQAEQSEAAAAASAAANVTNGPEQTQTTTQTVAEPDNSETPTDPSTDESLPEEQAAPAPPPSSEPTSEPDVTSIKNASVDEQRVVRGRDPMQGAPAQSQQQWLDAATERIAARPEWTGELLARLATDAFNLSPLEIAGLQIHRRRLVNAYNESANELYAAHQANDQPGLIAAQARLDAMDVELDRMEEATKAAGREWGRSGVARQIALATDFSLEGMTRRARVANGGAPLTTGPGSQTERIAEWDRRYRDADSLVDSEERESEYDRSHTQARRRAGRRPRAATRPRPDSNLGGNVDANNPSSVANLAKQLQRMFVEAGMTDKVEVLNAVHEAIQEFVPGMTRDETMDAMSGYGKYKELSKAEVDVKIRELNGIYQQLAKLRDMQNRKVPLKTGQERREVSDEERRLIAQVNEMKKQGEREGWYVITDPGKQARSTLAATKKALLNRIYDLTDEIQKREKNVKEKKDPITDAELVALRKLRDQMRSQHDEIFGRPELTEAQKIALAEKALDKAIKVLEDDISKGKIYPDHTGEKSAWSPAISAKKARLQALRDQRQELRDIANPKLTPEERANLTYARVLSKQIADYQQRLANGDFAPKPKPKPRNLTPALLKALADRDKVKLEFRTAQSKWKRDHRTKAEIAKDWAHEAWNLTRDLQTTGEASFTLRQGLLYAASHPLKFVKAVAKSFAVAKAWDNETELLKKSNEIKERPNAISGLYARAKVPFSDSVSPKTGQEELLLGRWAENIPLLGRAIKRNAMAGDAFLNIARADMFDAMASFWGSNPDSLTDAEAKQYGSAAGVFTGKGDFGNVGRTSTILNNLLFSFPFTLSRFQIVLGQPLMGGTMRTRTAIASEYVRAAMGLSVFYAAVQFALTAASDDDDELPEIDFNPLSSDFMKIRIGKTRLDPLAGLQQVAVFLARQIRNKKTSSAGVTVPLGGMSGRADDARDVVNNFAWSKAHPTIGMYFNQRTGQDMAGNEVTADELPTSFIPMAYPGMADAVREAGLPRGLVMDALSFAGANVSTYGASTHEHNVAVALKAADTMISEDKSKSTRGAMKGKVKSEFTGKHLAEAKQNDEIIRSARERLEKVAPSFDEQAHLLLEAHYLKQGRLTPSLYAEIERLPAFNKPSSGFQKTKYENWKPETDKQWVKRQSELDQMLQKSSSR